MRINKTHLLIAFVVVFGLSFQWVKRQSQDSHLQIDKSERLFVFEEIVPFARKAGELMETSKTLSTAKATFQKVRGRLIGQSLRAPVEQSEQQQAAKVSEQLDFDHKQQADDKKAEEDVAALLAQKAKEKEEEEKEVIGYDSEGNPIFKQAENEDDENTDEELAESDALPESTDKKEEQAQREEQAPEAAPAAGEQVVAGVVAPANDDQSEQEAQEEAVYLKWKTLIFSSPDATTVSQFIEQVQLGVVPASVAQRLTSELIHSTDASLRKAGASIAGRLPSFHNFLLLAKLNRDEAFGSELRESINSYLNQYTTLTYLPILEAVLTADSDTAPLSTKILATEKLDQAANYYINGDHPSQPGEDDAAKMSVTQLHFYRFIGVLEDFIASSSDPEAVDHAQYALDNLRALLES